MVPLQYLTLVYDGPGFEVSFFFLDYINDGHSPLLAGPERGGREGVSYRRVP